MKILVYGVLLALFWVFAVAHPALASTPRVSLGAAESYSVLAPEETHHNRHPINQPFSGYKRFDTNSNDS